MEKIAEEILEKEKEEDLASIRDLILERAELYQKQGHLEKAKEEYESVLTKIVSGPKRLEVH
jgi:Tfp pilus assembly protein PilF